MSNRNPGVVSLRVAIPATPPIDSKYGETPDDKKQLQRTPSLTPDEREQLGIRRKRAEEALRELNRLREAQQQEQQPKGSFSLVASEYNSEEEDEYEDEYEEQEDEEDMKRPRHFWRGLGLQFYVRKCERHRHRVSRDTLRRCQENRGGCRVAAFRKKIKSEPIAPAIPLPIAQYPRIADLRQNLRSSMAK